MLERTLQKAGASIAQQITTKVDEKINPKTEWHRFSCGLGHSFAVEIHTGINVSRVIDFYRQMKCPLCYTNELKKESNL